MLIKLDAIGRMLHFIRMGSTLSLVKHVDSGIPEGSIQSFWR